LTDLELGIEHYLAVTTHASNLVHKRILLKLSHDSSGVVGGGTREGKARTKAKLKSVEDSPSKKDKAVYNKDNDILFGEK